MRKLSYLLGLFSLFLITNVSASELDFNYDSTTLNESNNCQELYANVAEYIKANYEDFEINSNIDIQNDKVILIYGYGGYNGCPNNNLIRVGLVYDINSQFSYYYTNRYNYSITYYNFQLSFDSNYEVTGITEIPSSQTTMNSWVTTPVLDFYLDWRLGTNSTLTFNNQLNYDLIIGDTGYIIEANTNTSNLYEVVRYLDNEWYEVPNPYRCTLSYNFRTSVIQNISDFYYRVRGTTNALDYPIEGSFALRSNHFSSTDDFDFTSYVDLELIRGDESETGYSITATKNWDNSTKTFRVDYKIVASDDIDTNVDVIFKVTPNSILVDDFFSGTLTLFDCTPGNSYISNTYGYTDDDTNTTNTTDTSLLNIINNNSMDLSPLFNISSWLPEGPLDSILTLPLKILNTLSDTLHGVCNPYTITLPFIDSTITLPCINSFYDNVGANTFVNWVGIIASTVILIQYFTFLYNWIDNVLRLGHQKIKVWGTGGL